MKQETREKYKTTLDALLDNLQYDEAIDFLYSHRIAGYTMTYSSIKEKYNIPKKKLIEEKVRFIQLKNPHYACAAPMKCYLIHDLERKFSLKAIRLKKLNIIFSDNN
ncbi:MAG TPA: hypothetical protein PK784_05510 [Tenuifilaceae bacterium]|nr:hypothetical protein [Tenuifilaceae bacterium]HPN21585.1 hypothetical protein [Tenuifilaceae bacterium]